MARRISRSSAAARPGRQGTAGPLKDGVQSGSSAAACCAMLRRAGQEGAGRAGWLAARREQLSSLRPGLCRARPARGGGERGRGGLEKWQRCPPASQPAFQTAGKAALGLCCAVLLRRATPPRPGRWCWWCLLGASVTTTPRDPALAPSREVPSVSWCCCSPPAPSTPSCWCDALRCCRRARGVAFRWLLGSATARAFGRKRLRYVVSPGGRRPESRTRVRVGRGVSG